MYLLTLNKQMIRIWYDEMVCGPRYILIGYIVFKNVQNMYQAIQPTIKRNGMSTDIFWCIIMARQEKNTFYRIFISIYTTT